MNDYIVAPHAGAWIEMWNTDNTPYLRAVAPHAGAWIEMYPSASMILSTSSRSPCGSVD